MNVTLVFDSPLKERDTLAAFSSLSPRWEESLRGLYVEVNAQKIDARPRSPGRGR